LHLQAFDIGHKQLQFEDEFMWLGMYGRKRREKRGA